MQCLDEQNGSDSETFPFSCPLSYLQFLEVLLLHLLLCYNIRLILNLVYLLRGAVCLNLRHYPGDRGLESHCHNLRGKLRCTSSCWLADKPSSWSGSQPASNPTLAGWTVWVHRERTENPESGGWWQLGCNSRRVWLNITNELNKPRGRASENNPRQWLSFILF